MNYYTKSFSNKEHRLLHFSDNKPKANPESSGDKPADNKENTPPVDDPTKLSETSQADAEKAAKAAKEAAAKQKEVAKKAELDKANLEFKTQTKEGTQGAAKTPEKALADINKAAPGIDKFVLSKDGKSVEFNPTPTLEAGKGAGFGGETSNTSAETLPPLTEDEETIKKSAMQLLKLNDKNAEEFARAMTAIANALKALKSMFGKGGAEGATGPDGKKGTPGNKPEEDPKTPKGNNAENSDNAPGTKTPETGSGSPESGSETFDPKKSENPKEDADKANADIETLKKSRSEVEKKISDVEDGGMEPDEADPMIKLATELKEIDAKITAKEAEVVALDKELARRAGVIKDAWDAAKPKGGLVDGVTLDIADGNDIVITLAGGKTFNDLPPALQAVFTAMNVSTTGNTLAFKDVSRGLFDAASKAKLDLLMNTLAALSAEPAKSPDDKSEKSEAAKEGAEKSPEDMVKELNAKAEVLANSNDGFMKATPLGRILVQERYELSADGKNLDLVTGEVTNVSKEYARIAKANGRTVREDADNFYIKGYPGIEEVVMPKEGKATFPSRMAWGGKEGNIESQHEQALKGMSEWQSIIIKEVPADTPVVDAVGDADLAFAPSLTPEADKVKKAVGSLQGNLEKDAKDTVFGQFIMSLDVESIGDNIALMSKAEEKLFSYMYKKLEVENKLADGTVLNTSGSDGYVMQFDKSDAEFLVYNLGRWAAFMGATPEEGSEGGFGAGGRGAESPGGEKPKSPEQVKTDYDKGINEITDDVGKMREYLSTDSGNSYEGINEDGSIDPESKLGKMLTAINAKIDSPSFQVPDGNALDADLITSLSTAGHTDKILTGVDQGYQIIMDEDGVGVERIQPDEEPETTPEESTEQQETSLAGNALQGLLEHLEMGHGKDGEEAQSSLATLNAELRSMSTEEVSAFLKESGIYNVDSVDAGSADRKVVEDPNSGQKYEISANIYFEGPASPYTEISIDNIS